MDCFDPGVFFEFRSPRAEKLFSGVNHPWDAIKTLKDYIIESIVPEISGEVEEGAWLERGMVQLGEGSRVERGAIIRGPSIIGRNTLIRSGAYIRPNVIVGDDCIIGHGTELRQSIILDQTRLPHFNCIMVSILGNRVSFGAYTATSSIVPEGKEVEIALRGGEGEERKIQTGLRRFGAVIGDDFECGGHVFMKPGTVIGKRCRAESFSCISGYTQSDSWIGSPYGDLSRERIGK